MNDEIRILCVDAEQGVLNSINSARRSTVADAVRSYSLMKKNADLTAKCSELQNLLREKEELIDLRTSMLSAFNNILNAVPAGIIGIDPDDMIVQCNSGCSQIFGCQAPPISENAYNVLPPDILEFLEEARKSKKITKRVVINGSEYGIMGVNLNSGLQRGVVLSFLGPDKF
jgi:PAS domain-containing protein